MKEKLLSIALFFCLVLPLFSAFGFLYIQKKQVKREVKWKIIEGLQKEELVLIKITAEEEKEELHWEHSKEFEYKGEMYDVVEKKHFGDSSYYWCWWDHKETALNKKLSSLVDSFLGNSQQRDKNKEKVIDFYSSLFFEYPLKQPHPNVEFVQKTETNYILIYLGRNIPPITPPPQLC